MLAERRTTLTARIALAILLPLMLSVLLAAAGPSRGDFVGVVSNPDASRTAVWNMNTSAGLSATNLSFTPRHAELPWVTNHVTWSNVADFSGNGTTDANATALSTGIGLLADNANHIANSGFDTPGTWEYGNGTWQQLNATWNATVGAGMFHYAAPSTESLWASMDSVAGWNAQFTGGDAIVGAPGANTTTKMQGTASAELNVSFSGVSSDYAALTNQSTNLNWSSVDRLVLWVYLNASAPVTFNLSALDLAHSVVLYSPPESLNQGWQEVSVNLSQLAPAASRTHLGFVTLRVSGSSRVARSILFDDLRVGTAKVFAETAFIRQSIVKANATNLEAGSGLLGLQWSSVALSNLGSQAIVSVSGPGGVFQQTLSTSPGSSYFFTADVSSATAPAGSYTVDLSVSVSANTTAACDLTFLVDNVALVFPHRQNGSYTSNPIALINDSVFDDLAWAAAQPAGTSTSLSFRIRLASPLPNDWGSWSPWSPPGTVSLGNATGVGIQVRVALNTTNASVSPVLESLDIASHHRAPIGSVVGGPFTATDSTFLGWRNLTAWSAQPGGTAVQFYVGDLTTWTVVRPGDSIWSVFRAPTIYWRADLVAYDTLNTPTLSQVNLTYEYEGLPVKILISPGGPVNVTSGQNLTFAATAWDVGGHPVDVPSFGWVTTDTTGSVNQNGTYHAGLPGNYTVTAYLPTSPMVLARVQVHVLAAGGGTGPTTNGPPLGLGGWWPILLAIAGVGLGGFLVYEVAIRRLFSIDDVFLISKDGRLMMHNTRRMRADRDEDILSGMLTAIMSFLRDQDPEENGELKHFKVGGKTTLLERGRTAYLAAVYSGRVPRWAAKDLHRFMEDLDAHFGDAFGTWNGDRDDLVGLRDFTGRFARNVRYRRNLFKSRAP